MIPDKEENAQELYSYLESVARLDDKVKHPYYKQSVNHAVDMGVHVEGDKPLKLLNIVRPYESVEAKKYRQDIYEPVTQGLTEKIINTITRIFNDRFYKIQFQDKPPMVKEEESLETYTMQEFPGYISIMNFIKETFIAKNFSDPGAVCLVEPQEFPEDQTIYLKPVPVIYESDKVIDFKEGEYYTIRLSDKVIKLVKKNSIEIWVKSKKSLGGLEVWNLKQDYIHNIGEPPAFRLGGRLMGHIAPYWYFSFIGGVLPSWNRVVTFSSDLDANYIAHMYTERWEYSTQDCPECFGEGQIKQTGPPGEPTFKVDCPKCKGLGVKGRSPLGIHVVRPEALKQDQHIPVPPVAYITKPTDIVNLVEERIQKLIAEGFSSVNFEILNNTPAQESGIAKAIDRQDMDAFLYRYQTHIFTNVLPNLFYYISYWRYYTVVGENEEIINKMQPTIDPMRDVDFTVLSLEYLTNEYKAAISANVSSSYIRTLEEEIINNRFSGREFERSRHMAIVRLQPFPGTGKDQLMSIGNLPGVEDWEIYLSVHVEQLVDKAIAENKNFLELDLEEQREIVMNYAIEATEVGPTVPTPPLFPPPPPVPPIEEPEEEDDDPEPITE